MMPMTIIAATLEGLARATRTAAGQWQVAFPLPGQDVRCLAADPEQPAVIYAGTQGNGLLRSDDAGVSWRPAGLEGRIVKAIAVSGGQPGVVYAGTRPAHLFVSPDGGRHWAELAAFRRVARWYPFTPSEKPFAA